eukprot:TRINITY_DN12746_c0_g1_i17.p3 TRINITY_DN12746_c0_g1~~TRINITY_DN12746_c0_g1_i17.p3  ORF type:complete len:114 (+),score=11.60 TRINITY_DN12746_c0_g1_i17:199-540(+)
MSHSLRYSFDIDSYWCTNGCNYVSHPTLTRICEAFGLSLELGIRQFAMKSMKPSENLSLGRCNVGFLLMKPMNSKMFCSLGKGEWPSAHSTRVMPRLHMSLLGKYFSLFRRSG